MSYCWAECHSPKRYVVVLSIMLSLAKHTVLLICSISSCWALRRFVQHYVVPLISFPFCSVSWSISFICRNATINVHLDRKSSWPMHFHPAQHYAVYAWLLVRTKIPVEIVTFSETLGQNSGLSAKQGLLQWINLSPPIKELVYTLLFLRILLTLSWAFRHDIDNFLGYDRIIPINFQD
jgi:hypothetical protein